VLEPLCAPVLAPALPAPLLAAFPAPLRLRPAIAAIMSGLELTNGAAPVAEEEEYPVCTLNAVDAGYEPEVEVVGYPPLKETLLGDAEYVVGGYQAPTFIGLRLAVALGSYRLYISAFRYCGPHCCIWYGFWTGNPESWCENGP
jgi:hypothetical protein